MAQHFHVPLQSGCDRILRLMNRRYWTKQYAERMLAIHEQIPNAAMGADVMVGFPGETDQDHAASLRFIESLPYTYLHIFPFSARPGTPASTAAGQVNGRVARERSQEIRAVINCQTPGVSRRASGPKPSRSDPGRSGRRRPRGPDHELSQSRAAGLRGSTQPARQCLDWPRHGRQAVWIRGDGEQAGSAFRESRRAGIGGPPPSPYPKTVVTR